MMNNKIYHVSNWKGIEDKKDFTLIPGSQCAEGNGVYFSEASPRFTAAEGAYLKGISAVIVLTPENTKGWWRTKSSICKKFNRVRTWHSDTKSVKCHVLKKEIIDNVTYLHCSYNFS